MKKLSLFGRILAESLASNTSAFVCMLLAVPLKEHGTDLAYILPIMLFYACMKSGLYLLQGTVHIENPYKVLKYGILTAFSGSFFLLGGDASSGRYLAGAVITGIGLAPFSSVFKTITDGEEERERKSFLRKIGPMAVLILMAVYCLKCKKTGDIRALYLWCVYLGIICAAIVFMPGREKFTSEKAVSLKNGLFIHSFPALPLFLMMAAVSGYKSGGNVYLFILMLVSLVLFILWHKLFDDRSFRPYCARTLWLGVIRGFEMLYVLVFLANTNRNSLVMVLYMVIVAASLTGGLVGYLFRKCSPERTTFICMFLSLACMVFVISRNPVLMFAGVFFCVSLTGYAKKINLTAYRNDSTAIQDEYRLRQDKMFNMGSGLAQALTTMAFFLTGKLVSGTGNALMNAYVLGHKIDKPVTTLVISGIIMILFLLVWLIAIKKKSGAQPE